MSTSGDTVKNFLNALNDEDFNTARSFLNNDVKFIGVMGTRDGADTYITDMAKMKFKYNIQKLFEDGNDVSVFYDINMGGPTIFSSGWYQLSNGKISIMKVLFDPRPLLEKK
ncbi:MAG TPA: nuclear transport factor 2 family protein [Mucilaginibacter sp.]